MEYVGRQVGEAKCMCQQETAARVGRYRVTLCTTDRIDCRPSPCKPDEYGRIRGNVEHIGEPVCRSVEFDLTAAPQTVIIGL